MQVQRKDQTNRCQPLTKRKTTSQYIYITNMGKRNAGSEKRSNQPVSTLKKKKNAQEKLIVKKSIDRTNIFSKRLFN